ncbi:MAG: hypothetical protein WCG80_17815, partial [Spirochaetales bacterium]
SPLPPLYTQFSGNFGDITLAAFRALHPDGKNLVCAADVVEPYTRNVAGLEVTWCPLNRLAEIVQRDDDLLGTDERWNADL